MIRTIDLHNFKGIKDGEISGLGDINIFIGPNNSGKSTLLDSVYLMNHIFSSRDILGNHIPTYITSKKAGNTNLDSLHWKYKSNKPVHITPGIDVDRNQMTGIELEYSMLNWQLKDYLQIEEYIDGDTIKRETTNSKIQKNYDSTLEAIAYHREDILSNYFESLYQSIVPTLYIHSGIFQILEQIETQVWNGLYKDRSDRKVINKMNDIYNTTVDQLSYVPVGESPELQILFEDYAAQPGSLGDGFRYAFSLFSAIEAFSPQTVLVEEPENHQHPSAYKGIAEALIEYSVNRNIQFFIATHSSDFLTHLIDTTPSDLDTQIYHLDLQSGRLDPRNIEGPDLKTLQDLGIDPRRLEEYGVNNS